VSSTTRKTRTFNGKKYTKGRTYYYKDHAMRDARKYAKTNREMGGLARVIPRSKKITPRYIVFLGGSKRR